MASDLRQLADLLNNKCLVKDSGPLKKAEAACLENMSRGYSVERLLFRELGKGLKVIPNCVEEHDLTLEFSFRANGPSTTPLRPNPFGIFELEIHIYADYMNPANSEMSKASCAWHLDFHLTDKRDNLPTFIHPKYHFQHGGRLIEELGSIAGPILIIDAPRLAHPPMDAILGIDFVLTNFIERSRLTELREDGQYRNLVKRAQERLWRPYFLSLASVWSGQDQGDWSPDELLPQLIVPQDHLVSKSTEKAAKKAKHPPR